MARIPIRSIGIEGRESAFVSPSPDEMGLVVDLENYGCSARIADRVLNV